MFFDKYPYSNFHELNLDWLINRMKELDIAFDEFKVVNHITFSGQWDITKQYPAWTIVSDNNIGYVSIQPVPVGVTLTDTNYWVEVIDYTAQIAGLQTRVVALENTVGDNSSGLVKDMNDAETDIDALEHVVYKKYAIIGDSYCDPTVSDDSTSIITHFIADMGLTENVDFASQYNGGWGFVSDGTKTFESLIPVLKTKIDSSLVAFDSSELTDLIVLGGDNDAWHTRAQLDIAIESFINAAKLAFPNAQIHIGEVGNLADNPTSHQNIALYTIPAYQNCSKWGAHYLSGVEVVMMNQNYFMSDNIHPTGEGMKLLGGAVKQALFSKYDTCYTDSQTVDVSTSSIGSTTSSLGVTIRKQGENLDLYLQGTVDNPGSSLSTWTTYTIGTIPSKLIQGSTVYSWGIGFIRTPGNVFVPVIVFLDNKLLKIITTSAVSYGQVQFINTHLSIPAYIN